MIIEIVKDGKRTAIVHNMPAKVSSTRLALLARKYNRGQLSTWIDKRDLKLAKVIRLEKALAAMKLGA
jgi:hypothetical protein